MNNSQANNFAPDWFISISSEENVIWCEVVYAKGKICAD